jgi:hypothetical protein
MTSQPDLSPMPTHNPENERIKRRYFAYLKEAKRRGEPSVDAAAKALSRFELDTRFRSFKTFHPEQAVAFKRRLAEQTNARTGKPLAKATIHSTLAALKAFFVWLAGEPGFRSRLSYSDADYFNLSDRDARIARTRLLRIMAKTPTSFVSVSEAYFRAQALSSSSIASALKAPSEGKRHPLIQVSRWSWGSISHGTVKTKAPFASVAAQMLAQSRS